MKPIPALDSLLESLMRTCSLTDDNHVPLKGHCLPELKVMFKIPWVFSEAPGLANHGITSQESLTRYMKSNRKTYIRFEKCVSTRKIYRKIPSELDALIDFTKILHKQTTTTLESLQALIDDDKILKRRLRNTTSTQEFLRRYSAFFGSKTNGSITPLIHAKYECDCLRQCNKKVDSLVVINKIRRYIEQMESSSIKLSDLLDHLRKIGFDVNVADLRKFLLLFYNRNLVYNSSKPKQVRTKSDQPLSQIEINEIIDDALKKWPVSFPTIQEKLNCANVFITNHALRAIIEGHFPDYFMKDGLVSKDFGQCLAPVRKILGKKCIISLTELRNMLESRRIGLPIPKLIDLVVRNLRGHFIYEGKICLPTSKVSGKLVANSVLDHLSLILEDHSRILLEDLVSKMASREIFITEEKLKMIIEKHSTMYRCEKDCVCLIDDKTRVVNRRNGDPQPLCKVVANSNLWQLSMGKYIGEPKKRVKSQMNSNVPEAYRYKDWPEGRFDKLLKANFENRVRHRDKVNFKRNKDPKNSFRVVGKPKNGK